MRIDNIRSRIAFLGAALCAVAGFALAGCGGSTTNGANLTPVPSAGPSVQGLQPLAFVRGDGVYEVSGFGSPTNPAIAYDTAGIAYGDNGLPPIDVADGDPFPLGFAPGGAFVNSPPYGQAVAPGAPVIFRAAIATGQNGKTNQVTNLNPSSVVLTSPEVPGFSEPLAFSNDDFGTTTPLTGPLANGTYTTAQFTLPFTTTGLHTVKCSCADEAGNTAFTTFQTLVLASNAAAVLVEVSDAAGTPVPGLSVKSNDALAGVTAYSAAAGMPEVSVTDANGVAIVFVNPADASVNLTAAGTDATSTTPVAVSGALTVSLFASTTGRGGQATQLFPTGPNAGSPLMITANASGALRVRSTRR